MLSRRSFLQLSLTGVAAGMVRGAESAGTNSSAAGDANRVTTTLARYLVTAKPEDIPANVKKEAARTVLNWAGVTVAGAQHETVDHALAAVKLFSGPAQAQIIGRKDRLDLMSATLINGISTHVLDFDDTHLKTIIHPGAVIIPAALALAEYLPDVSGEKFLHAVILGGETALRVGNAVYPAHYDAGWHITGTAGSIGAAATAGRLLGLSQKQMTWALGIAASQQVGLRESFGSMTKSFNPGRAGQNGVLAALLASKGFTSSDQMLEAQRGWARTVSSQQKFSEITGELGTRFEMALNTYKPFACGVVIHPVIDGCIQLRNKHRLTPADVTKVELRVNPLVLELTGKTSPRDGLEGKFSVFHSAAIALSDGRAGPKQFSDAAVQSPDTIALRQKVTTTIDSKIKESQADVTIVTTKGERLNVFITDAVGSVENPLGDRELEGKTTDLMDGILPEAQIRIAIRTCWNIGSIAQASSLASMLRPPVR